jgi:hypothetical protein
MNEFVLFFRMDILSPEAQPTPAQMEIYMNQWQEWIDDIAEQNKLAEGGNHLSVNGTLIGPYGKVTDGPYVVNNESVAGYILIFAKDMDEAVHIAKACPILLGEGTSVEVRKVAGF